MNIIKIAFDFLWPYASPSKKDGQKSKDIEDIENFTFEGKSAFFFDEVRRLRDIENTRKSNSETKSQIYSGALLAIIPILISLVDGEVFKNALNFKNTYEIISFGIFVCGIIYGVGAFFSSYCALTVKGYSRIDTGDFVKAAASKNSDLFLAKEILKSVREDRLAINAKVTYVIVSQKRFMRMAICIILSLFILYFYPIINNGVQKAMASFCA